ncbi:MAG TPA: hypothetical protein VK498_07870 [Ferruginibacter sp.]|nr:hypothetical protein [Ferruginibacter sp.]
MTDNKEDNKSSKNDNKDAAVKPEPETLHTTDPQKNMEGPVSSLMKKTGKTLDSGESQKEADEEKEENM